MSESNLMKRILIGCSALLATVFRNNTGIGWAGEVFRPTRPMSIMVTSADVVVRNARPLHAGLCKGSSDIIGWMSIVITPGMIGRKIAVFLAMEVKENARATAEQLNFIDAVHAAGGIAGIVRSEDEAKALMDQAQDIVSIN